MCRISLDAQLSNIVLIRWATHFQIAMNLGHTDRWPADHTHDGAAVAAHSLLVQGERPFGDLDLFVAAAHDIVMRAEVSSLAHKICHDRLYRLV